MGLNWGNPFHDRADADERDDEYTQTFVVDKLKAETDKAIGVEGNDGTLVWLPKSQIIMSKSNGRIEVAVPGWLAAKQDNITFND